MKLGVLKVLVTLWLLSFSLWVYASPIQYRVTGSGSGDLAGSSFSNANFEIEALADTSAATPVDVGVFVVALQSFSIQIAGFMTLEATNPTYFFVNQGASGAGFLDLFAGDFFDFVAPVFSTFDAISNIGPLAADSDFLNSFDTTGGILTLGSASQLEFSSTVQPLSVGEPGTISLVLISMLAALQLRRSGPRRAQNRQTLRRIRLSA